MKIINTHSTYTKYNSSKLTLDKIQSAIKQIRQVRYQPIQGFYLGQYQYEYLAKKVGAKEVSANNMCEYIAHKTVVKVDKRCFLAKEVKPERLSINGWRCDIVYWDEFEMVKQALKRIKNGQ